jgi:hypothetical protein
MAVGALANLSNLVASLPLATIEAAINDPTNLSKQALVVEDIISDAVPGIDGVILIILVSLFVNWVYQSGGGTIAPDLDPEVDAQTTTQGRPRG